MFDLAGMQTHSSPPQISFSLDEFSTFGDWEHEVGVMHMDHSIHTPPTRSPAVYPRAVSVPLKRR